MGPPVAINKVEVAAVNNNAAELRDNENRLLNVDGVGKRQQATCQAKVPKRKRDDAALHALTGDPLHKKPGAKNQLTEKANSLPDVHGEKPCKKPAHKIGSLIFMGRLDRTRHSVFAAPLVGDRAGITHLQPSNADHIDHAHRTPAPDAVFGNALGPRPVADRNGNDLATHAQN